MAASLGIAEMMLAEMFGRWVDSSIYDILFQCMPPFLKVRIWS